MRNGTLVTMSCTFDSAVFKQLLKQQVHDAGADTDFRDDRRGQAGFESVNLLQHPVRANRTSKMWLMWLRMIPSFNGARFSEKNRLLVRENYAKTLVTVIMKHPVPTCATHRLEN